MSESISERRSMPLLFTSLDGGVFELKPEELLSSCSSHPDHPETPTIEAIEETLAQLETIQFLHLPNRIVDGPPDGISTSAFPGFPSDPVTTPEEFPFQPDMMQHLNLSIQTGDGPPDRLSVSTTPGSPRSRCGSPLIEVVIPDKLLKASSPVSRKEGFARLHIRSGSPKIKDTGIYNGGVKVPMVYNEYGELKPENTIGQHPTTDQLSFVQLLRVIKKAYHHDLRNKLSKLVNPHPDSSKSVLVEDRIWSHSLSSWDLRLRTPKSTTPRNSIESLDPPLYRGQRRVLEIGCSDGSWCFAFKREQPDWLVEGLDDTEHWSCIERGLLFRDFSKKFSARPSSADYFNGADTTQSSPEFTVRNINCLLTHEIPIPCNTYEFIRAREIFDRVESYKNFLEDVRCLLKSDGVVEFIEIDPRPRISQVGIRKSEDRAIVLTTVNGRREKRKSTAATDWTDRIEDRFKDPLDQELATTVPGWSARVAERLKAILRPRDGVSAANLKSWVEGAGFWDVKQHVLPIPVGGSTKSGKLLEQYLLYQLELENCIPKLFRELPKVETADLGTGAYHLNIHIVTGRKPVDLRPGDLMTNGERREMTMSKYDAMANFDAIKSSQWKRFDIEGKNLSDIMQNLTTLPGAPEARSVRRGTAEDGWMPLLTRHSQLESPFNAPPFVTVKEMEEHIKESGIDKDGRTQAARMGLPRLSTR